MLSCMLYAVKRVNTGIRVTRMPVKFVLSDNVKESERNAAKDKQ